LRNIISKATANATEKKALGLLAIKKMISRRSMAALSLETLSAKMKKSPGDQSLKRMHAELVAAATQGATRQVQARLGL